MFTNLPLRSSRLETLTIARVTKALLLALATLVASTNVMNAEEPKRMRLRDAGIIIGTLPTGPLNALTDVEGVKVGHTTIIEGAAIRTGVTAIFPHDGDLFQERVPAAIHVGNGFGKLLGVT